MVFESLIADLLNKYLGEYVENLDRSQLKIGIWGGDVVLNNLKLKQSALDDLQLPVKTVNGFLGKLTLKIPWKNLYSAPVEASVENLYLLVVPNTEIKYDADREEKLKQDAKQQEINKVEEAKRQERDRDKPKGDDTFSEKLATQIVRNVQISIKNIHIRYEDRVNNPGRPFALGVTLSSLIVTTTDLNWQPFINQDMTSMIYKILAIEGLSVYWNPKTHLSFLLLPQTDIVSAFQEGIATKDDLAKSYQYMLGPINATSKLRLNTKPESDGSNFSIPKVLLNLDLQKLQVRISKSQYQDLMVLLDSMDRMSRGAPFRKYRPNLNTYKGNYSKWWKFAYQCIVEEEVRRRKRNWDWLHIHTHRTVCREYSQAYQLKLLSAKPAQDIVATCERCERSLDVLNIVLIRQKIEVEVERRGLLEQQKKSQAGWFSGWWGGGAKEEETNKSDIKKQFQNAMTSAEKEKLFRAIGYQENAAPAQYPVTFVAMDLNFFLHSLEVEVRDETHQVLSASVKSVGARCEQRPAGQAIKVSVKMEQFLITGFQQGELLPQLVQTKASTSMIASTPAQSPTDSVGPLLDVVFEVNPLDKVCDQRVHVNSRPLHFVYDAQTINKVIDVFTVEQNAVITQLQTAANTKLEEFKEKSALGLQYAIQKHTRLDLKIDLKGIYCLLPHGGLYTGKNQALVVVNLGRMIINSAPKCLEELNVQKMHRQGTCEEEIMKEMMNRSYDRFTVQLKDAQAQMVLPGESWGVEESGCKDQYLLHPITLKIKLAKCLFQDNPRLPKIKILVKLPSISLKIAERRLLSLIALLVSIPLPESKNEEPDLGFQLYASQQSLTVKDITRATKLPLAKKTSASTLSEDELLQFTELEAKFELKEVSVVLFRKISEDQEQQLADFQLLALEGELTMKTYDMIVCARLGGLSLFHHFQDERIHVINTPMAEGKEEYLFVVNMCRVDRNSPEFHSKHGSVVQLLEMNFSRLDLLVHQEAVLDAVQWANNVQIYLSNAISKGVRSQSLRTSRPSTPVKGAQLRPSTTARILGSIREEGSTRAVKKQRMLVDTIDLKLLANLGEISVALRNSQRDIGTLYIKGGESAVIMKRSYTQVNAKLKDFEFIDLRPDTRHPKVLSILGQGEAVTAQVVMFNTETHREQDSINMSVTANMACFRIVFLNYVVMSLVDFMNQFSAAQAAILEASAAAAEAAKANVHQAYKEAFRIRLNIQLKAPIIIVPANSMSYDAVLLDFGYLSVVNTFQELKVSTEDQEMTAVMDNLHVGLQNLQVSRVKLNSNLEVVPECFLLQPISFQLTVQRNLSAHWYTSCPDMDISGRLESIHVTLTQSDYNMIMAVVSQNLGETPLSTSAQRNISSNSGKAPVSRPTTQDVDKARVSTVAPSESVFSASEDKVRTNVKFTFTMDSLVVDLYCGGDKEVAEGVTSSEGLARFTLYVLSVKGSMLSDSSLTTSVLLLDCLLDDTRSTQVGKIFRYMERKPTDKADTSRRSMVDITYQQKLNTSFVDMRVYSFILILNMEHLMQISQFFTSGLEQSAQPVVVKQSKSLGTTAAAARETPPPLVEEEKMITVTVKVEQPDIILVENMDDINTNAIIMNNEMSLKLRMTGVHQFLSASLKDLELFCCNFNPAKRRETKAQILRPVSVSVTGSTPSGQGLHVDVKTTKFHLSVTPGTIELLNRVMAAVTAAKQDKDSKNVAETDHSKLWEVQHYNETSYWFLKTELGEDATLLSSVEESAPVLDEICIISVPSVVITVEAGVGTKTLPMLLLESNLQAHVRNWSSSLTVDSTISLQVAYYNSRLALWEPLIEPVECLKPSGPSFHTPWELNLQVETNDPRKIEDIEIVDGLEIVQTKPKMVITVSSKDSMELTVTKTCLEVLNNLGTAFNNAIYKPEAKTGQTVAPYVVQNDLGLTIKVVLSENVFKIFDPKGEKSDVKEVVLESGAKVDLCLVEEEDAQSLIGLSELVREKYLQIKVVDYNYELDLPVTKADKRYFSLQHRGSNNDVWGLVSDVTVQDGSTLIVLRGIIQVMNHFNTRISVYFMTKKGNELELVGTVEPNKHLNLPLQAIYTLTNELFFSVEGYSVSISPFIWKDLQKTLELTKIMQCNAKYKEDKGPFYIKGVGEMEQVYNELSNKHTMSSQCYNINLRPTVILKNFLPVEVIVCTQGLVMERQLPSGERMQIPTCNPGSSSIVVRISGYLDREWSCKEAVQAEPPELSVWTFQSYDSAQRITLDLGMHCINENGTLKLALYCPFWMLNKTGLMLSYRKSSKAGREDSGGLASEQADDSSNVLYHPADFKGPIMFSFRAKVFFGKKKACIKLEQGEWSDKFSLDVAGSSGVVSCKAGDTTYQIGVHITLNYNSLTKQVTFTPYRVLVNHYPVAVQVREVNKPDAWIKVEPNEVSPFWPKSTESELVARLLNTDETTIPFPYNRTNNCLLKLKNKYGAMEVDVQMTEGAVYITFNPYTPGMAPALIINHSSHNIPLREKHSKDSGITLKPSEKVLFTWSTTGDNHALTWCEKYSNDLRKDEIGDFTVSGNVKLFWVSFLDGMQRVLLFTPDVSVARGAEAAGEMEAFDQEVTVAIHGLGLSLVDNVARQEVMYIGITSSGTIWETRKSNSKKFKPVSSQDNARIEDAYIKYQQEISIGGQPNSKVAVADNLVVDFVTNQMLRPNQRALRRTYNQGLWLQMRNSPHQCQLHAKVNRLQIDNQTYDCVFPVVLAPVPPPKSVSADNAIKPFAELSVVQRLNEHSAVQQFKYYKILVQEFHIKVDIGFINAMSKMFEANASSDQEEAEYFAKDCKLVDESLIGHVALLSSQEQKNFYDFIHFSPLKIHVSFSLSGGGVQAQTSLPPVINVLMQSLGVTLTDIQDVVLKLSYFERNYTFLNQKQLLSEVIMHYRGQLIKQLYVLVLGLDVLGNPFGLVVGITEGVQDLFYEPFQGAIQGPGEFAEGLVLGVRSLFGHTVGGAAGAVSRITGAMGKSLAALTFDEEYQRKRREAMNYRPSNVQEGLAQSGKGLVMGVVEGVSGVITKPISGAKEDGVGGFFMGVGKGMMGLVTRPTAGVIDFASGSFSAVKRAAELGEEVTRLRHPRYFKTDSLVRPYCRQEAEGNKLLKELEKGKYYTTDTYAYHTHIGPPRGKDILLLTDKRLLVLSHNDIFGGNQVEFSFTWGEMVEPPVVVSKGVQIKYGEGKKKLFRSNESTKVIFMDKEEQRFYVVEKMKLLMMAGNTGTGSRVNTIT